MFAMLGVLLIQRTGIGVNLDIDECMYAKPRAGDAPFAVLCKPKTQVRDAAIRGDGGGEEGGGSGRGMNVVNVLRR